MPVGSRDLVPLYLGTVRSVAWERGFHGTAVNLNKERTSVAEVLRDGHSVMKPPVAMLQTASRKCTRPRRGSRGGTCSGRKPKRLTNQLQNGKDTRRVVSPFFSPEMFQDNSRSPQNVLTPPPFNFSFGSDLNDEVLSYMDKLDGNIAVCSTPLALSQSSSTHCVNKSASAPLFDISNSCEIQRQSVPDLPPDSLASDKSSFLTTPAKKSKCNLQLSSWRLPEKVMEQYAKRGITSMFEWQAECLMLPGVLSGGNLVYSAPTSAGKTLIAELLALKCVLESNKKVIIILPFVSIAHEKSNYLRQIFEPVGVKVGGFMGNQSPAGGFAVVDIAICTIEKANTLVNRLLEENTTYQLGAVVVDELHMIGDPHRGYLLELLLTKLMYVCRKSNPCRQTKAVGSLPENIKNVTTTIQLIGMSATLPNLDTLAGWLKAELFHTDFRPVPLREMVKIGPTLYDTTFQKIRDFDMSQSVPGDEDDILLACRETVAQGHSVLIFCPTKSWCENLASTLARAQFLMGAADDDASLIDREKLFSVSEQLRRTQVGLDRVLEKTVPNGVAFHHAGLTFEEREIVEGAFRETLIKILIATSTLSSGVNLPARLVIVRTPFFQRSLLDVLVYKQMVGRAGRKGVDKEGESILICKPTERSKVVGLLNSAPKPVQSCLGQQQNSGEGGKPKKSSNLSAMKRALLEVVASRTATTTHEIETYASCTLLFAEMRRMSTPPSEKDCEKILLQSTLKFLIENEFIAQRNGNISERAECAAKRETEMSAGGQNLQFYATQLGEATVASALAPEEALVVFSEFRKARRNFVLENELHIIYLVTPVYIQDQWPSIDWYKYLCLWERLPPDMKHVADTLGISESFLTRAIQGRLPERTSAQRENLRVHRRFFTALALHDLVHEVPLVEVGRRYGATKGLLQTLQSAAGTFAGMVTVFCNRLGWKNLELLLSQFQNRLMFGVERELCDLVRISLLNGFRARVLYNAGFHTLAALATANPITVETCLRNAVPFKSRKLACNEGEFEPHGSSTTTTWCAKLKRGMTDAEAARVIVQEAQTILSEELNVPVSAWGAVKLPIPATTVDLQSKPTAVTVDKMEGMSGLPVEAKSASNTTEPAVTPCSRSQRKNPNTATNNEDIKERCLQSETGHSDECEQARTGEGTKIADDQMGGHASDFPGFRPASLLTAQSILQATSHNEQAELDNPPKSHHVRSFSPTIPPPPLLTAKVSNTPASSIQAFPSHSDSFLQSSPIQDPCDHCGVNNDLQTGSLQNSPAVPLTIPDSLPSIDMSMSFSCQTFAMIDAACHKDTAEGELQYTKTVDIPQQDPNKVNCVADSPRALNCVADSPLATLEPTVQLRAASSGSPIQKLTPTGANNENPPTNRVTITTPSRKPALLEASLSFSQPNLKELSSLCSSHLSQSGVTVIDITANETLFETFVAECLEQRCVSFSLATSNVDQGNGIGSTIVQARKASGIPLPYQNKQVVGVAFCWGEMDVYYLSLSQSCLDGGEEGDNAEVDHGSSTVNISINARAEALRKIFTECNCRKKLIAYDIKQHIKFLALSCGIFPSGATLDPKVASWMLDPDAKEKTIHRMVLHYLPDQPTFSEEEDSDEMPLSSLATHASDPQMRASAESILSYLLMSKLEKLLETEGLYKPFIEIEMPSLLALTKMELNGIGFSADECNHQKDVLQTRLSELEREAYILARRSFSLTSPEDVAQVLFIELQLPSGSERKQKTLGPNTRRSKKRLQHLSTAKDVLEKIKSLHPLPGIILEWRRISSTVTKMVFPLFREAVPHECTQSLRIHPTCQIHTATGRVAVVDPNLQMVPKEYNIGPTTGVPKFSLGSTDVLLSESQCMNACQSPDSNSDDHPHPLETHSTPSSVCMRNVFVPFPGGVFLAADYSQLELRILAHVSGDEKLKRFLNGEGDVFKMIAGEWLGLTPSSITNKQRQEAKQVCYGMIYGIGAKALGEQLGIIEEDAAQFMETFRSKYRTVKAFIAKTVLECKEKGYVCTILGRKRFLPSIHSPNIHARNQAERQAVNTTIQGSAADLAKTAMVNIDKKLAERFPNSALSMSHHDIQQESISGAYLVLQLHDELLYEVAERNLKEVAEIVKYEMENALELSVKFPVKIKVGHSWGKLESYSM